MLIGVRMGQPGSVLRAGAHQFVLQFMPFELYPKPGASVTLADD